MIIAVDFDGTCVDHKYPDIGEPAPHAIETMQELVKQGDKLILWTMRSGKALEEAEQWFKKNEISLWGSQRNPEQDSWTNSPKCYAQLYIDDAAFGCPLVFPKDFTRPCVDWLKVRKFFWRIPNAIS